MTVCVHVPKPLQHRVQASTTHEARSTRPQLYGNTHFGSALWLSPPPLDHWHLSVVCTAAVVYFAAPLLLFTLQDLYVGLTPYSAPAVFGLLAGTELTDGVWYPLGGFGQVRRHQPVSSWLPTSGGWPTQLLGFARLPSTFRTADRSSHYVLAADSGWAASCSRGVRRACDDRRGGESDDHRRSRQPCHWGGAGRWD